MKEQEFVEYCNRFNQLICDAMDQFISGCNIEEISEEDVSCVIQAVLSNSHLSHFVHFYVNDISVIEPFGEFVKDELKRMHLESENDPDRMVGRA